MATDAHGMVSRRSVVRGLGLGGATIVVTAAGLVSYRAFDNGVMDAGSGAPYDAWMHWRTDPTPLGAVGAAILAASPHNQQGWTFRVTAQAVDVFADPTREMPMTDPFLREHHVGLGCALENLARGYRPEVILMPSAADPTHVASVTLIPVEAATSSLHDAIGDRHSNRGPYESMAVPDGVLRDLAGPTGDSDVRVHWLTSPKEKEAFSTIVIDATRAIIDDRGQSEEFFIRFRNNRDDIDRFRDGVTLDGQGLAPLTLTLAKLLPAYSRAEGDQFWLDQTRTVHTATAAAFGVVTVAAADDPRLRLAGGRLLQRVHLGATSRGLGLQHMNQVTERMDRERDQSLPASFAPLLRELLPAGVVPLVAFRLGTPVRASRPSPRRPLQEVLR
ncbi:hypothetical protein [Arthrobacter sp. CG_A4]|uniref:hypothetical protein n=1 Tax=Arthrobacter sp. CG_A4 TaxID=3071706 RepID=UPI002DFC3CCF|nr:hypothetical protein [Arthrobacter sp. CG_A4]